MLGSFETSVRFPGSSDARFGSGGMREADVRWWMSLALVAVFAVAIGLTGCTGQIAGPPAGPDGPGATPGPSDPGDPDDPSEPGVRPPQNDGPDLALDTASPRLLPFEVRLARVASVLGVDAGADILSGVRRARIALGDYDHSRGILPDGQWSATRMVTWMSAMRPLCESQQMRGQFPSLPGDLQGLASAAWGRTADPGELTILEEETASLGEQERYAALCVAVLSSAEFVFQ